jgi:phosphoribosylamine--glycine ligase
MKFLLYSVAGEGAQVAKRIELEGNEVGMFIKDKIYKSVFSGLLTLVEPEAFIDKDTTIIFDLSGNGPYADTLKRKGHFVYGASAFADDLEHDREFGFEAMRNAGIRVPNYEEFNDWAKALTYVQESNKRLVFKPSGSMPCKLTYVSKDNEELLAYLKFVEKHFAKDIDSFILQEFIEGGVLSSEFFCDGTKFLHPGNHTVEVKKSMNDDLGASTGCSGNITWPEESSKILDAGVAKIESLCVKHGYVGQIDLNAVVNDSGVYGLEWTPRFGYDATPTLLSLLEDDFGKFFYEIARGELKEIKLNKADAGAVRVTIPPYPAEPKNGVNPEKFSPSIGVPILNWEDLQEKLYFYEVALEEGQLVHSGGVGVVACALGMGQTPYECMDEAYSVAEELNIPDKQYRTDLREVLTDMVEEVLDYV